MVLIEKTIAIAGGGVIGLSIARLAARRGLQVVLLEKNGKLGMETSSRNSEVIHAGLYYPSNSLKAALCVSGNKEMYAFCEQFNVPFQRCGKLIVAGSTQTDQLRKIASQAHANGVTDVKIMSRQEAKQLEPEVECSEALYSPSTGIVDSHALMLALEGDAEAHGAAIALNACVDSAKFLEDSKTCVLSVTQESEQYEMECDYFVNCTGMFSPRLMLNFQPPFKSSAIPSTPTKFAKGTYFKLRSSSLKPFRRLIYPIPEVGGLGVHATIDMQGNVRFGPDVEWVPTIEYEPNPEKAALFAERIQMYWPRVREEELEADYCGIRPKITVDGVIYHDFFFGMQNGLKAVHLCGIESPGLTSSLSIAKNVLQLLDVA